MCRQCLVEVDTGRGPALMPSCMFPVAPDMKIETESPTAKRAQEGMIELLLANHPLDCPVCDKGGECPLQDQAFSHGPGESRYVEAKRNFEKPIPISDLVLLDRERCILCDRCTRFADEVAGDKLIHFINRGNLTQVNTFPDEPFASYFSGNVVQICPVGALTAKPYRFKARPWDLEQVDSTCTTCSVGCRDLGPLQPRPAAALSGRRHRRRPEVNWGWMCDRGRFGFEAIESPDADRHARWCDPTTASSRPRGRRRWRSPSNSSTRRRRSVCSAAHAAPTRARWRGRVSPTPSTSRTATHSSATVCRPSVLGLPRATIDEAAGAATVILLGPDLKEELPVLYLRLRDAAVQQADPDHRVLGAHHRHVAVRVAQRAAPARSRGERDRHRPCRPELSPLSSPPARSSSSPGAATSPSRRAAAMTSLRAVLDAVPGAACAAGPAPRQRRRRPAARVGARPTTTTTALATLRAAADGKLDLLVLLGADPINDCPDADLARRAPGRRRRGSSRSTRSCPIRRGRPTSCWRRPRSVSRTAPRPTSRAASRSSARRSRRTARRDPTG